jgi:hypothetical protein
MHNIPNLANTTDHGESINKKTKRLDGNSDFNQRISQM